MFILLCTRSVQNPQPKSSHCRARSIKAVLHFCEQLNHLQLAVLQIAIFLICGTSGKSRLRPIFFLPATKSRNEKRLIMENQISKALQHQAVYKST
jgi:hypothetical protein